MVNQIQDTLFKTELLSKQRQNLIEKYFVKTTRSEVVDNNVAPDDGSNVGEWNESSSSIDSPYFTWGHCFSLVISNYLSLSLDFLLNP